VASRLKHQQLEPRPDDTHVVRTLLRRADTLELDDDILYTTFNGSRQYIVPHAMQAAIMYHAHAPPTAGHFSTTRTIHRVKHDYYWVNFQTDIKRFCKSCLLCQQTKRKNPTARAPLGTITATRPFQIIAIDIMGPLPRATSGHVYILSIVDYFTKWLEVFPLRNIQSQTVVDCLVNNVFTRYGVPTQIHTDQGGQFESQLFQGICETLHIHKTRTSPYHPQSDGLVERSNRTIQNVLKSYVNAEQTDWHKHLPFAKFAYNTSVQSSTKYTPFFLMFGREATMPLHIIYPPPHSTTDTPTTLPRYVQSTQQALHTAYTVVRANLDSSHRSAKQRYDRTAKTAAYVVGDLVWLHAHPPPHTSPKLFKYWTGPWKITHKRSAVTYTLQAQFPTTPHMNTTTTAHSNRLRRYHTPPTYIPPTYRAPLLPTPTVSPSSPSSLHTTTTTPSATPTTTPPPTTTTPHHTTLRGRNVRPLYVLRWPHYYIRRQNARLYYQLPLGLVAD